MKNPSEFNDQSKICIKIKLGIFFLPIFFISIIILLKIFLGVDSSEYREVVKEDGPIEYATTFVLFCSAIFSGLLISFFLRTGHKLYSLIYLVVTIGLVFFAFEEISWGQRIFGFETPDLFSSNVQGETTIHNLDFIQEQNAKIWGVAGFIGAFGWIIFPKRKNKIYSFFTTFLIPRWFFMLYFIPLLGFFFISLFIQPNPDYANKIYLDLIIERDQEIAELLFFLGILFFMVTNYFSNKS